MLLFTRKKILDSHFSAQICSSLAQLGEMLVAGPVHLVVVCQSVADWECDAVIELSRAAWPEVKILVLNEGTLGECTLHSDTTMENLEGPPAFLYKVHMTLGVAPAEKAALG
jgi:hypothetical protein